MRPEQPLAIDVACAAIEGAFPEIDSRTLEYLGSGWDFDAYRTGDGWVFRFPRQDDSAAHLDAERSIVELVRDYLPPDVALPFPERVSGPVAAFPHAFAGHRYIGGAPADAVATELRPTLARSVGAMLGGVHAVPVEEALAAGVGRVDHSDAHMRAWFEGGLEGLSALAGSDSVVDTALGWVRALPDPTQRLEAPQRFIHHDLSPEHILVDPGTGQVTGVLDWTDATIGDPARDFVILVALGGWGFAERVLEAYPHRPDPGFRTRLGFMARLLSAMWLGWANAKGEDFSRHLRWVESAFAERFRGFGLE